MNLDRQERLRELWTHHRHEIVHRLVQGQETVVRHAHYQQPEPIRCYGSLQESAELKVELFDFRLDRTYDQRGNRRTRILCDDILVEVV